MFQVFSSANSRLIFLVDGLGALLSTILLIVVSKFEKVFGMPASVLHRLLPLTIVFTAYSLGVYLLNPAQWKKFLGAIAVANSLYACVTMTLVVYHIKQLTGLGIAYFLAEIVVILFLSRIELRLVYPKR